MIKLDIDTAESLETQMWYWNKDVRYPCEVLPIVTWGRYKIGEAGPDGPKIVAFVKPMNNILGDEGRVVGALANGGYSRLG